MKEVAATAPFVLTAQWVLPVSGAPIENGYVRICGSHIEAMGAWADLPASERPDPPAPGTLITPGLVNTHGHLEQSFEERVIRGEGETFIDWISTVSAKQRREAKPESRLRRSRQGVQELLAGGTTCINDVAGGSESLQALDEAGMRGLVSLEFFDPGGEHPIDGTLASYHALREQYRGHPRLQIGLSPHAPFNVIPDTWHRLLQLPEPPRLHTHLAESEDEVYYLQGRPSGIHTLHQRIIGKSYQPAGTADTPTAYMARHGILTPGLIAAHAIHTTAQDRQLLAKAGVRIAHCPRSNLALHDRTLVWADWADAHIPVGLGTDGRLSTEDLDLRAEARTAMAWHGWHAATALEMATRQGARVLGWDNIIGTLAPGRQADVVLWQGIGPTAHPEAAWLDTSTRVVAVYIDGCCRWP